MTYFTEMEKIFLRNSFFTARNEKYYMTCPDEGTSINDFIAQNNSKEFVPFWKGYLSEIKTEEKAAKYVDMTVKATNGQQFYINYTSPDDTVCTVSSAYESFMSAVEALSALVGHDVDEIILFHD